MTFAEWPSDDAHHHPVSLPAIVSTTDLFDGELFGDELIDIYNSTVDDGAHGKSLICNFARVMGLGILSHA